MAEVYRRVKGMKIGEVIARCDDAQAGLRDESLRRALVAEAVLREHRYEGDSKIRLEHGLAENRIDWFVVLDDTRGLLAAMTIEYGRRAYRIGARQADEVPYGKDRNGNEVGAMKGIHPLGIAFGLEEREHF